MKRVRLLDFVATYIPKLALQPFAFNEMSAIPVLVLVYLCYI